MEAPTQRLSIFPVSRLHMCEPQGTRLFQPPGRKSNMPLYFITVKSCRVKTPDLPLGVKVAHASDPSTREDVCESETSHACMGETLSQKQYNFHCSLRILSGPPSQDDCGSPQTGFSLSSPAWPPYTPEPMHFTPDLSCFLNTVCGPEYRCAGALS